MNNLENYRDIFSQLTPFQGQVGEGFYVDFLGALTHKDMRPYDEWNDPKSRLQGTRFPKLGDGQNGEGWFEAVNWVEAAREARGSFTMVTLGACYGAQAVGAQLTLQAINPMPSKLVLVEPEPDNFRWCSRHLADNGIDPAQQWLVPMAISDSIEPVLFPVGAPGSGAQNCISTDFESSREHYLKLLMREPGAALRNLLLHNSTGLTRNLVAGLDTMAEIKFMSSITLREILGPFAFIDYLESDIQQSEVRVFPPFIDLLTKKVRRVHIGTHGADTHNMLHSLFVDAGWEIVFSYAGNTEFDSPFGGKFKTNDGILTATNPALANRKARSSFSIIGEEIARLFGRRRSRG